MKNDKIVVWVMVVGVLCIAITPYLFTHYGFGIDFTSDKTNNIGGTIGGITAPFAGILGSYLVYKALKAQLEANQFAQDQNNETKIVTYLTSMLEMIKEDIINFTIQETRGDTISYYGNVAMNKFLNMLTLQRDCDVEPFEKDIYQIDNLKELLLLIDNFVETTLKEKITDKDKIYLLSIIRYHYITKIKHHFDFYSDYQRSQQAKCSICGEQHNGIPNEYFDMIKSINHNLKLQ